MSRAARQDEGTTDVHLTRGVRFGPIAALLVAALLRFYNLGLRPVWTDEG